MTAIHLRKLVKKYGDTTAVDGIDLDTVDWQTH